MIDPSTYDRIKGKVRLQKSAMKIFAYGTDNPLPLKGRFQAEIESKNKYTVSQIYVIQGTSGNLLSAKTAQELSLIKLLNKISIPPVKELQSDSPESEDKQTPQDMKAEDTHIPRSDDPEIDKLLNKYKTVFVGQGKLKNEQIKLHINEDISPVAQPQRRIPYHLRKAVSKELEKLVEEDIIEKVTDQPTPWISPIVCTPKKDGGTRICVDMREANQAIQRERHVMPTLQDFKAEVNGSKFFSKIDLKQAYHQLELHPESRFITTFSTHEGLFRYKRLNYGTNSAAEIFQNVLQSNLSDIRDDHG